MKKILSLLMLGTVLTLTACGQGVTTNQGTEGVAPTVENTPVSETNPPEEKEVSEDYMIGGKYKVEFGGAEKVKSTYEDVDLLQVTYTFTNNSEEAISADSALMLLAYQDGVEMEQVFEVELTGDNASKSIKSGVSLDCKALFKLTSESEVEVEATEFLGLDDSKVIKTYALQ